VPQSALPLPYGSPQGAGKTALDIVEARPRHDELLVPEVLLEHVVECAEVGPHLPSLGWLCRLSSAVSAIIPTSSSVSPTRVTSAVSNIPGCSFALGQDALPVGQQSCRSSVLVVPQS
jgi:hypothetical protein